MSSQSTEPDTSYRAADEQPSPDGNTASTTAESESTDEGTAKSAGSAPHTEERDLRADLLPFVGASTDSDTDVVIKIYVVTGRHGLLKVPESFCRECHLFTRRAEMAAEQVDASVDVRVYSWWTRFLGALRHGGFHPPVMVVGGKRLCQGHDVPTSDDVVEAIEAAGG